MATVTYVTEAADATFAFHAANGEQILVSQDEPLVTDDAGVIAYLDSVPFVKRSYTVDPEPEPVDPEPEPAAADESGAEEDD